MRWKRVRICLHCRREDEALSELQGPAGHVAGDKLLQGESSVVRALQVWVPLHLKVHKETCPRVAPHPFVSKVRQPRVHNGHLCMRSGGR